jgi:hypothetical protein
MRLRLGRLQRIAFATLAAIALCAGLAVASFLPHTDDGCAVETHCLSCRLTLGTVAVAVGALPSLVVRLDDVRELVWTPNEEHGSQAVVPGLPARAPPLS